MDILEDTQNKVLKLLNLATSTNDNEALIALRKANKILKETTKEDRCSEGRTSISEGRISIRKRRKISFVKLQNMAEFKKIRCKTCKKHRIRFF